MSRELRVNRCGNATRGIKIKDKPPVITDTSNGLTGAPMAPRLLELTQALALCRQQIESARHKIGALSARNAALLQALNELAQKEAQAHQMAYYDSLTGLPNRNLLQDRFSQAISQAERRRKPLAPRARWPGVCSASAPSAATFSGTSVWARNMPRAALAESASITPLRVRPSALRASNE